MWLVIGYGNELRGDDAAGALVAERLTQGYDSGRVRVRTVHQLTPELALELAAPEVGRVLFVDARREQASAAELTPLKAEGSGRGGHQQSPQLLLYLSRELYGKDLPGWLLTVAGSDFSLGAEPSPETRRNLQLAKRLAIGLIEHPAS